MQTVSLRGQALVWAFASLHVCVLCVCEGRGLCVGMEISVCFKCASLCVNGMRSKQAETR